MSPGNVAVSSDHPIGMSEVDGVLGGFRIKTLRGIEARESVVVLNHNIGTAWTGAVVAPALKVGASWPDAALLVAGVQEEISVDRNGAAPSHFDIGFAISDDISLYQKLRSAYRQDAIVVIATSRALGLRVDVGIKHADLVAARDTDCVARAGSDLGVSDRDVGGVDQLHTITGLRADVHTLDHNAGQAATINGRD